MSAANTDKFIKGARKLSGNLDASGILNDTVDNFGLITAAGLPTDTAIEITIDRVDANGTKTPTKEEVICGVVSGDRIISATRGVEGTAQAHAAGAVWEIRLTASQWNKMIAGILAEHNQDGSHKDVASQSRVLLAEQAETPDNPDEGYQKLYFKDDGKLYKKDDAGNESEVGGVSFANLNAPEGFLINGKIVASVTSNNVTVAIKGTDGNDPSASNPVYVRIGDTIRTITAALSVTKNAGTNWFNSGSAGKATIELDYFVYFGYNATDGVVIGFSPVPYGLAYSDFSTTATDENYCAISTIANAAAGDNYVNIGRFGATLSAGAGYTWSVPTFTHINLIQRPIYHSREITLANSQIMYISGHEMTLRVIAEAMTLPNGAAEANKTVTFSKPFTAIPVVIIQFNAGAGIFGAASEWPIVNMHAAPSVSGFAFHARTQSGTWGGNRAATFNWIATGKI